MPRLPVTGWLIAATALAGLCFAGPALAQEKPAIAAPVKIQKIPSTRTMMLHMNRDQQVDHAKREFVDSSQMAMFYYLCTQQLKLKKDQIDYSNRFYRESYKEYYEAYFASHQRLTGKLPTEETKQAILTQIKKEQDDAAVDVSRQIKRQPDCRVGTLLEQSRQLIARQQLERAKAAQEAAEKARSAVQ